MTTTYNITYNARYDSHEVTFESKPATSVLDALKALKMRWNPKKACWYGFAKEHEIINAILENGEGETITGEKTEGATVYTDGYLGGGAVYGSKSNLHLYGADLSKAIREDIKRAGIKGVSVRCKRYTGGQSVGVTVSLRPDEFVSLAEYIEKFEPGTCGDYGYIRTDSGVHRVTDREFYEASAEEQQKIRRAAAEYEYEQLTAHEASLSIYYIDKFNHFVPETHEKIKTINKIICAYRYDDSNSQVDYFDTNFYYDIYTKPAAVKPTTPDDEPTKPAKDEPKEEPATEETAPVQPAEQAQEAESVVETVGYASERDVYAANGWEPRNDQREPTPKTKKEMLTAIFEDQIERGTMIGVIDDIGEYAEYKAKELSVGECREWYNAAFNEAALPKADYNETINKAKSALIHGGFDCAGVTISHRTNKREFTVIRYSVRGTDDVTDKLAALNIIDQIHAAGGISFEAYAEVVPADCVEEKRAEAAGDAPAEAPEVVYVVDNNGHDIVTRHLDGINYEVTFREDEKPLGNPEVFTIDSIMFVYGIDVTAPPVEPTETASEPQQPENALDIAYTANLRRVYENTLSRMANNEYYGSETENGVKLALEYLEAMPEILTEDQINHAMRLAMCRRNSPVQPTPEPTPAETIPESAGDAPAEVPETADFHPIINNFPKKSKWDVWNVHPDEYLSSCVVPLVRCDENYHVLDTVFLKVDTPEEVKTLMSAAAVGNRRRWPKYNKQYRRETVQRAADIIEKYYI